MNATGRRKIPAATLGLTWKKAPLTVTVLGKLRDQRLCHRITADRVVHPLNVNDAQPTRLRIDDRHLIILPVSIHFLFDSSPSPPRSGRGPG